MKIKLAICILLLTESSLSYSSVCKFIDEKGKTHYSDCNDQNNNKKTEEVKIKQTNTTEKQSEKASEEMSKLHARQKEQENVISTAKANRRDLEKRKKESEEYLKKISDQMDHDNARIRANIRASQAQ